MSAFIILFALVLSSAAQAHTTGKQHVHLSCPGEQHCPAVASGQEQLPATPQTDTDKAKSDKEH